MLEITGDDIASLNDDDLRSLVGKLCESDLHTLGISTSAVTWGGDQNAADGGIDVRVCIDNGVIPGGFIPRAKVGFQVKKTDFTASLISSEMRPSGHLRDSIVALVKAGGAYIIASSGANTSDSALINRKTTMRSAVADIPEQETLYLDFYDSNRLATWTRCHPGLVAWVRQKCGRGISGWQTYSAWAASPNGVRDEYLLDDTARMHTGFTNDKGINTTQGIDHIRSVLCRARGVVRLTGLSGVGKTRFVQALFDARLGDRPLDAAQVIYTDMNDSPSPQPTGMISDLIASNTRTIVVVDNCAPDLHRRVSELCRASDSQISAITIEYDVQEDEPEGTEVFRLEPSSAEVTSNLIARRFPNMTRLDVDKIAEFSGGNARIALALANTLEHRESIAGLQDEQLFKRLFHQRQVPDDGLLKAAQACALLYSFQGYAFTGNDAELPKIAALVGIHAHQLFAKVAQLEQRGLVQRRSVWRAILPHAIANRLAKMALREIPSELIEQHFDTNRQMKSFSRRLGYLHESNDAKRIAERWLAKDGLLGDVCRLNNDGFAMFESIAPISPEATLSAIECALSGPDSGELLQKASARDKIGTVLRSIAYEASLFNRCVAAMIPLALAEPSEDRNQPVGRALTELFHIFFSGTHATIEQRVDVTSGLLHSYELGKQSLGCKLFEALLQAEHFSPTHAFNFGARVRDYGYWPAASEERSHWFATTLQLSRKFIGMKDERASAIRALIAQSIGSIWFLGPEVQEQLEAIAAEIAASDYWQEGWIAIRSFLSHSTVDRNDASLQRLRTFESHLRPSSIAEQVRAVVLSPKWGAFDYADMDDDEIQPAQLIERYAKAEAASEVLGKSVSVDEALLTALLPELVRGPQSRLESFGKGLALASTNHRLTWNRLIQALAETEEQKQNVGAIVGFLAGLSTVDSRLCETLLEEAVENETLCRWFPALQSAVTITAAGTERLKRAATLGKVRPGAFEFLAWRSEVCGDDLKTILLLLAKLERGYKVAIDILAMRFGHDAQKKTAYALELIEAGRELLTSFDVTLSDHSYDYHIGAIAKVCLSGREGSDATRSLCERIKQGLEDNTVRVYKFGNLLDCIFELQPRIALDVFFGGEQQADGLVLDVDDFDNPLEHRKNPLDGSPVEEILQWCDEKPAERYPQISRAVSYHTKPKDGRVEWTSLAMEMFARAPDPLAILKVFVRRFYPRSWSGSLAAIIESRLGLLEQLHQLENASFNCYVVEISPQLVEDVTKQRRRENERDSAWDERFE